jgi:hypothetical protein
LSNGKILVAEKDCELDTFTIIIELLDDLEQFQDYEFTLVVTLSTEGFPGFSMAQMQAFAYLSQVTGVF